MKTLKFQIEKAGQIFTLTHSQDGFGSKRVVVEGPGLFETGDTEFDCPDEKKDKLTGSLNGDVLKFSFAYVILAGKKYGAFKIDADIVQQIEKSIEEDKENYHAERKDREANRPAPYLDRSKFEAYNIGCDTGLIYHENKKAISLALKNGAKQYDVLRGERDETNKYPNQMDDFIPVDFAKNVDGKYTAPGYRYVYAEHYCISKEDYKNALAEIEAEKEAEEKALQAKFEEAARTLSPVVISRMTMAEEDSPLANDGEGDIVDAVTYAMPDGTTQTKYSHNF